MRAFAEWVMTIIVLSSLLAFAGLLFMRAVDVIGHVRAWKPGGRNQ